MYKTANTKKYITIISVIMSAIIFAVALTVIFMNDFKGNVAVVPGEVSGGMILDPGENDNQSVSFVAITIPKAQYADYGISPIAETAQQITATVTPASAEYKTLDWSVAWESGTSGKFGNGKNVTDYVTITPTSDGALTATLTCKQAFGETIILTASLRGFPSIKGTRKVQYQQKLNGSSLNIVYTNSSYPTADTTWEFNDAVYSSDDEYFSSTTLSFPKGGSTFAEFKDYYSSTGSKKGNYSVTVTIKGTDVYTKPMDVGEVVLSFDSHPKSQYTSVLSGANGVFPSEKFNESIGYTSQSCVLARGNGANATFTSGFDFVNFFCLEKSPNLNWGLYKQLFSANTKPVYFVRVHAAVNNSSEVNCGYFAVLFDSASFGTFASSVNIGTSDIVV